LQYPWKSRVYEPWGKCERQSRYNLFSDVLILKAKYIIEGAESRGELKPGGTIVEATAGT
jgi:cysteine synthase